MTAFFSTAARFFSTRHRTTKKEVGVSVGLREWKKLHTTVRRRWSEAGGSEKKNAADAHRPSTHFIADTAERRSPPPCKKDDNTDTFYYHMMMLIVIVIHSCNAGSGRDFLLQVICNCK